jgi:hypothetical protein
MLSSVPSIKFIKFNHHISLTLIGTAFSKQIKLQNKNKENFLDTANIVATVYTCLLYSQQCGYGGVLLSTNSSVDVRVYPNPPRTVHVDVQGVSISTSSSVDLQGVYIYTIISVDV